MKYIPFAGVFLGVHHHRHRGGGLKCVAVRIGLGFLGVGDKSPVSKSSPNNGI